MISQEHADDLRARNATYNEWAKQYVQKNGWTVIPADAVPPVTITNGERGLLEQFDTLQDPPARLFAYYTPQNHQYKIETWTGDTLGFSINRPNQWRSNMGDSRASFRARIGNAIYAVTAYLDAGNYCRCRRLKTA